MDCNREVRLIDCSFTDSDFLNFCVEVEKKKFPESSLVKKEVVDLDEDFSVCRYFDLGIDGLSADLNVKKENVDVEENDLAKGMVLLYVFKFCCMVTVDFFYV